MASFGAAVESPVGVQVIGRVGQLSSGLNAFALPDVVSDPPAILGNVQVYGKAVAGVTRLFAEDSDGTISQLTPFVASGWTDDGAIVRLTTASDSVAIGIATLFATEKVRIIQNTGGTAALRLERTVAVANGFNFNISALGDLSLVPTTDSNNVVNLTNAAGTPMISLDSSNRIVCINTTNSVPTVASLIINRVIGVHSYVLALFASDGADFRFNVSLGSMTIDTTSGTVMNFTGNKILFPNNGSGSFRTMVVDEGLVQVNISNDGTNTFAGALSLGALNVQALGSSAISVLLANPATGALNLTNSATINWVAQNRTGGPFTTLVQRDALFQNVMIADGDATFKLFTMDTAGVSTERVAFKSNGFANFAATVTVVDRVGIGTTGPSSPLHIVDNASNAFRIQRTSATAREYLQFVNASGFYTWRDETAGSDRLFLDTAGIFYPNGDGTQDLGKATNRWKTLFAVTTTIGDLNLGFKESDGEWLVKEGADTIFLTNKRNGRRYKMAMVEET